jgi:hypothetical protein
MPKRTNERQQIIEMLRAMLAGSNCTVTPSKMLRDAVTGAEREVDVVAEYDIDGDVFVQSFEVTSKVNRADLTWAEQLIKKHENLPTGQLYLVSWSGFTKGVFSLAKVNPRVRLVTPEIVKGELGAEVKRLFADFVTITPTKTVFIVEQSDGTPLRVAVVQENIVFAADGTNLMSALDVYYGVLNSQEVTELVLRTVHDHPERESLKNLVLTADLSTSGLHLRKESPEELQPIKAIEVEGTVVFEQQPFDMEVRAFLNQRFAHGRANVGPASGLLVAVLDERSEITKLQAQVKH